MNDLLLFLAIVCLILSDIRADSKWQVFMVGLAMVLLILRLFLFFKIGPISP